MPVPAKYEVLAHCIKNGATILDAAKSSRVRVKEFGAPRRFYVYMLVDPRTGRAFYVGKGKGQRALRHVNLWRTFRGTPEKDKLIGEIVNSGHEIKVFRICNGLSEDKAIYLENYLIREIGHENLVNSPAIQQTELQRAKAKARHYIQWRIRPNPRLGPDHDKWYWRIIYELSLILAMKDDAWA